jgi:hypothetical protein
MCHGGDPLRRAVRAVSMVVQVSNLRYDLEVRVWTAKMTC